MFFFFPLLQKKRGLLEPPLEGFESSTAASHGDICDLDDSVHATRGMAANTNTGFYNQCSETLYTHPESEYPSFSIRSINVLVTCAHHTGGKPGK